jgi:hypothetical protein
MADIYSETARFFSKSQNLNSKIDIMNIKGVR